MFCLQIFKNLDRKKTPRFLLPNQRMGAIFSFLSFSISENNEVERKTSGARMRKPSRNEDIPSNTVSKENTPTNTPPSDFPKPQPKLEIQPKLPGLICIDTLQERLDRQILMSKDQIREEEKEYTILTLQSSTVAIIIENCKFCGDKQATAKLDTCDHVLCDECFGMAQAGGNLCLVDACDKIFTKVQNIKTGQIMIME